MAMTSRQRVLTALAHREPDRVPWVENNVSNEVARAILKTDNFTHVGYAHSKDRKTVFITVSPEVCQALPLDSFTVRCIPPRYSITKTAQTEVSTHDVAVDGKIKTWEDLKIMQLPDPDDESMYGEIADLLQRYGGDLCRIVAISPCAANTYLSMGIPHFIISLVEQPQLVLEIMNRYAEWNIRVLRNLRELPFDMVWAMDDIAFGSGPMMTPEQFRTLILPVMRRVTDEIRRPWGFHSDGNLMPVLEDLLSLGMNALANIEPGPMDIEALKRDYGQRICLMGNIDLHYTLTRGTPQETMEEVRRRIAVCGPGGGYFLASANSLAPYVKPENVLAMKEALLRYGYYPLEAAQAVEFRPVVITESPVVEEKPPEIITPFPVLYDALIHGQKAAAESEARRIMTTGVQAEDVVEHCLVPAMEDLGRKFELGHVYLPEMIMAAQAASTVVEVLRPYFLRSEGQQSITVVMGTVKDDVHDIGKNIVATILEGAGLKVVDLGTDVPAERFINAVQETGAKAVGLSALLSTTLGRMEQIVQKLRETFPEDPPLIMVGGAPVTDQFARSIGADFRGKSGSDAVSFIRKRMARTDIHP